MRTRGDARGARLVVGAGGGAVALMVEPLSSYSTLPDSASLSSYRYDSEVRAWGYTDALGSLRQVVAGDDSREVGLHSLRIGASTTLAAGG